MVELRIVGRDGPGPDHHRIAQRTHAMQVQDVLLAGDELGLARMGGDEAVEALAQMTDGQRSCRRGAGDWQVELEKCLSRVGQRQQRIPACACTPRDHRTRVLVVDRDENALLSHCERARHVGGVGRFGRAGRGEHDRPGHVDGRVVVRTSVGRGSRHHRSRL